MGAGLPPEDPPRCPLPLPGPCQAHTPSRPLCERALGPWSREGTWRCSRRRLVSHRRSSGAPRKAAAAPCNLSRARRSAPFALWFLFLQRHRGLLGWAHLSPILGAGIISPTASSCPCLRAPRGRRPSDALAPAGEAGVGRRGQWRGPLPPSTRHPASTVFVKWELGPHNSQRPGVWRHRSR